MRERAVASPFVNTPAFDRRAFLAGTLALGLAACGEDPATTANGSSTSTVPTGSGIALAAAFPQSGFIVPGISQRLPFLLAGSDGAPLDTISGDVAITITDAAGAVVTELSVAGHADGVPRPYLPVTFTPPAAGTYQVQATYQGEQPTSAVQVGAATAGTPGGPLPLQVGDPFPVVDSPTVTDARGVDPVCTNKPACPLHSQNVSEVLRAGKPMLVLVSTPLYCQSNICGPVLELVVEAAGAHPELAIIHCEVYADPLKVASVAEATLAAVPTAVGLPLEPALFAVGADGKLRLRLDSIFDRTEIAAAIAAIN